MQKNFMSTNTATTQNIDFATEYNPLTPPQRDNPYPIYARARKEAPVFYNPMFDLWHVTRYEDVAYVLESIDFSATEQFMPISPFPPSVLEVLNQGYPNIFNLIITDLPEHRRLQHSLRKVLTPKKIAEMESFIGKSANELVDSFVHQNQVDLIVQFTSLLPMKVTSMLLGLPSADTEAIKQMHHNIPLLLWGQNSLEQQLAYAHSTVALQHYLSSQVEARRVTLQDDLLTDLINVRLTNMEPLITSEIVKIVTLLLHATNAIFRRCLGNALMLLTNLEQLQALRENLNLIDKFVEEAIRMEPPLKGSIRTARKAVEISGVKIPAGGRLQPMLASANRDENYFSNPDRFDIHRKQNKHFSFGHGIHPCMGFALARLQARIAVQVLLQRLPNLRQQSGQVLEFEPSPFYRELKHLIVEWDTPATKPS